MDFLYILTSTPTSFVIKSLWLNPKETSSDSYVLLVSDIVGRYRSHTMFFSFLFEIFTKYT